MPAYMQVLDLDYSKLPALALLGGSPSSHLVQLGLDVSQAAGLAAALPGLAGLTRLDLQLCVPTANPMEKGDIAAAAAAAYLAAPSEASVKAAGRSEDDNWVKRLLDKRLQHQFINH